MDTLNVCILYFGRVTVLHGEHSRILNQLLQRQYRNTNVVITIIVYLLVSSTFKCLTSNPEMSRRQS